MAMTSTKICLMTRNDEVPEGFFKFFTLNKEEKSERNQNMRWNKKNLSHKNPNVYYAEALLALGFFF